MARFWVIAIVAVIAFMIFTLIDVLLTDRWRIRGVPKAGWVAIVLLLPLFGGILWFAIGKGSAEKSRPVPVRAPDDDPTFLNAIRRDEESDERIRRLEQQLAELDDDPPEE